MFGFAEQRTLALFYLPSMSFKSDLDIDEFGISIDIDLPV